ncbi:hypothetical protein [uncultured Duncaniella sp.]|uniref:hypothetical protein n=1 Tax=uncultured Duncaniella sp. TaxID=2768039 RepID=UPI00261873DC|nr:hypothetical protein [uncultured Duncaniella sp.]
MKKSYTNIADLIRKGANVKINSDDFRFSEISNLARIAANNETMLHIKVGDNINAAELAGIANTAKQFVLFDLKD